MYESTIKKYIFIKRQRKYILEYVLQLHKINILCPIINR